MTDDKPERISIGFYGGGALSLRVLPGDLAALREALSAGGWHELPTEEGPVLLDTTKVIFIRQESGERRTGF
jgi:hypothetical protein